MVRVYDGSPNPRRRKASTSLNDNVLLPEDQLTHRPDSCHPQHCPSNTPATDRVRPARRGLASGLDLCRPTRSAQVGRCWSLQESRVIHRALHRGISSDLSPQPDLSALRPRPHGHVTVWCDLACSGNECNLTLGRECPEFSQVSQPFGGRGSQTYIQ